MKSGSFVICVYLRLMGLRCICKRDAPEQGTSPNFTLKRFSVNFAYFSSLSPNFVIIAPMIPTNINIGYNMYFNQLKSYLI